VSISDEAGANVLPFRHPEDIKKSPEEGWEVGGSTTSTIFAQTPKWLLRRQDVSSNAVRVYSALVDFTGSNQEAWPKQAALAAACGLTAKQVKVALRQLRERKLVEVKRRGRGLSNVYRLLPAPSGWIEIDDLTSKGREACWPGHPRPGHSRPLQGK
jgi:hypothetical protein